MATRKITQAPGLSRDVRSNQRPQQRGFWDWLFGIGHHSRS